MEPIDLKKTYITMDNADMRKVITETIQEVETDDKIMRAIMREGLN